MLRNGGYIKVLDFGLARRVAIEAAADSVFGILRYMSPEQATGLTLTPANDVFSFGAGALRTRGRPRTRSPKNRPWM
jgi:serine/threonine-protein kinase